MEISVNWISDFCDIKDLSSDEIYRRFTLSTAEVEHVQSGAPYLKDVKVVEILSFKKHPEADKLNLVTFKTTEGEKEVVCGAPNVRVGLRTFFAPVGVTLPNGMTLEPKKIRGYLSQGMLCSAEELQLKDFAGDGILDLPENAVLGTSLQTYLNLPSDTVLTVDNKSLTHRPDLWGHFGISREFAAVFKRPLNDPYQGEWEKKWLALQGSSSGPLKVSLEGESAALCFYGLSIDAVKVTESPSWMQARLIACGMRPINSIVDISNYVMLELGSPLHIYDRDKIEGGVLKVSALTASTTLITLDGVKRDLTPGDTVISDSTGPLVLAGIMGGESAGVSTETTKVFIEVANWKAALVRKTSQRLGLRTDSSQRFEKTLDSQLCLRTLLRTLELLKELNPDLKVQGKLEYVATTPFPAPLSVQVPAGYIQKKLGKDIAENEVLDILKRLAFKVESSSNGVLNIQVPSFRATKDISGPADIVEEVGRMIGFDHIAPSSPLWPLIPVRLTEAQKLHRKTVDFCVQNLGALEILSYPLVGEKLLKATHWPQENLELKLVNALSVDHDRMRPSLLPTFLEAAVLNQKNFSEFKYFEWGRAYVPVQGGNFSEERQQLAIGFYQKSDNPMLNLLNGVEKLLTSLQVPFEFTSQDHPRFQNTVLPNNWLGRHPQQFMNVQAMGKAMGGITLVHPMLTKELKIRGELALAILDFTEILKRTPKEKLNYQALNKFPTSSFDVTVTTGEQVSVEEVLKPLKKLKNKLFLSIKVVGVYAPEGEPKSVTVRTQFGDPEKTLDSATLKACEDGVIQTLAKRRVPFEGPKIKMHLSKKSS